MSAALSMLSSEELVSAGEYPQRATLLVTTVEIGEGRSATIEVLEGDDPRDVASRFCAMHGLPESIADPLTLHLLDNLEELNPAKPTHKTQMEEVDEHGPIPAAPLETTATPTNSAVSRPRGPSLVQEATATAAEVTEALASFGSHSAPMARPSSANSSLASEYYGRPMPSASTHRTAEASAAPAADRLYADHFRKQQMLDEQRRIRDLELQLQTEQVHCTPVSRALAAHRTADGYASYGERLYVEGRLDAMRRAQDAERVRAEDEEAEMADATFQPQISRMAQALKSAAARGSGGAPALPWDRLHSIGAPAKREVRAETIRREQEEAAMRECTFKPSVDARSERIMRQRRATASGGGLALHHRLYHDARHRQGKLDEVAARPPEGATFTPHINTSSIVLGDLTKRPTSAEARDVAARLLERGKQYGERLEAARKASAAPVDDSGRELFHPKTYRGPRHARNPAGAPIGEYLYSAALDSSSRAAAHAQEVKKRAEAEAASTHVNALSTRMMDRLKKERFKAVYAYLGRAGASEASPAALDLLAAVADESLMNTMDPEVRADVEHAARLLQQQHHAASHTAAESSHISGAAGAADTPASISSSQGNSLSLHGLSSHVGSSSGHLPSSTGPMTSSSSPLSGCVDEDGFVALMHEVLQRTRGVSRQYLMPLPGARKKWDDPTFKPSVDPHSLALAARSRPDNIPAHEVLYRTAAETQQKKEIARAMVQEARLKECSFRPALVAAPAKEGRALKQAFTPMPPVAVPVAAALPGAGDAGAEKEGEGAEVGRGGHLMNVAWDSSVKDAPEWRRKVAKPGQSRAPQPPPTAAAFVPQNRNTVSQPAVEECIPVLAAAAAAPEQAPAQQQHQQQHYQQELYPLSAPVVPSAPFASMQSGESLEDGIDAIEQQIKDAMARLSMTGETFLSSLQGGGGGSGGGGNKPRLAVPSTTMGMGMGIASPSGGGGAGGAAVPSGPALAARLRASLDYHALFGAGSPLGDAHVMDDDASVASTMRGFNPLSQNNPLSGGGGGGHPQYIEASDVGVAAQGSRDGGSQQYSQQYNNNNNNITEEPESEYSLMPDGGLGLGALAAAPLPGGMVECAGSSC